MTAHNQNGASLLEAIAYLCIAAFVLLGAIALLQSNFSSAQANNIRSEIVAIRSAVRKLYTSQPGYGVMVNNNAQDITDALIKSYAFPTSLTVNKSNSTLRNAWGGTVRVWGAPNRFIIEYDNVPQDVCINLLFQDKGWVYINTNNAGTWFTVNIFPVTMADALSACSGATQEIEWASR